MAEAIQCCVGRTVHIHGAASHCAHANAELQYNQWQPALSAWICACAAAAGSLDLQDCDWTAIYHVWNNHSAGLYYGCYQCTFWRIGVDPVTVVTASSLDNSPCAEQKPANGWLPDWGWIQWG